MHGGHGDTGGLHASYGDTGAADALQREKRETGRMCAIWSIFDGPNDLEPPKKAHKKVNDDLFFFYFFGGWRDEWLLEEVVDFFVCGILMCDHV